MGTLRDFLEMPRKHPIAVLITHVPLLVFWVAVAVRDIADGSIKLKRGAPASLAFNPTQFYVVAALIVAVAVFIAVRIVLASVVIADEHGS